ncbi:MAG: mechanosensitive ion channel domain-containing protein [Verrucomicrobiota bacterium]
MIPYALTKAALPSTIKLSLIATLLALIAIPSHAQENAADDAKTPANDSPDKSAATTTSDPDISTEDLKLLLTPLTQADTLTEADAWRDLVKAKALEVSKAAIARETASSNSLREQKAALVSRLNVAINAYERKGGDPTELRKYARDVSGIEVDLANPAGTLAAMLSWLTSKEGGLKWLRNIAQFAAIMVVFWFIARIVGRLVRKATDARPELSDLLKRFLNNIIRRTVLFIGVLVALSTLGVNISALLALIGGSAFIIGFALQDTLGNFASGLMLLIYRPFDVGDAVEVGGVGGKVDAVSLVSTTIRTFDNKVVLVPNKHVWGQVITNATASGERRVDMVFGIGYDDDAEKAKQILQKIVSENELVLDDPEPVIQLNELADSSVNFICRPWAKTADYWTVFWDVTRRAKEEFDANNINIPYPQQDIHIHQKSS